MNTVLRPVEVRGLRSEVRSLFLFSLFPSPGGGGSESSYYSTPLRGGDSMDWVGSSYILLRTSCAWLIGCLTRCPHHV